jgi:hypothetical protein
MTEQTTSAAPESDVLGSTGPVTPGTRRKTIWPRPSAPAGPAALRAAGLAGLGAAALISFEGFGVGWALFGVLLAVLTWTVSPRRPRPAAVVWGVLAVSLLGVGVLRDAEWLETLCVLGAMASGSLALAGGRSTRRLLSGAVAVVCLAVGGMAWAQRGVAALRGRGSRLAAAALAGVVVLAVFTPLLASADAGFARLLPHIDVGTVARWIVLFVLGSAGMIGAGYLIAGAPNPELPGWRGPGRLTSLEWGLPVGLLVALLTVFVAVTLRTLFGGDAYVLRTTGMTYAQYARGGFWQLLAVTVLTLAVIAAAAHWAAAQSAGDRAWLRGLLGALSLLTLVIVASALSRMWAYQQAYGFSVLRLLVASMEIWLGAVYVMILAAGRRLRAAWLPRSIAVSGAVALLAITGLNPEALVAARNVARFEAIGKLDTVYLSQLSADAVPALVTLPQARRDCVIPPIKRRLDNDRTTDWRAWNPARARAKSLLASVQAQVPEHCPQF